MASNPPIKVLMLHGYSQNLVKFKTKTGGFRKALKKYIEPVFIDAPHLIADSEDGGRAWWFSSGDRDYFSARDTSLCSRGFDESVAAVRQLIAASGPFGGVVGFSQGAAFASLLCTLQQNGAEDFGFKFAVLISGFRTTATSLQHLCSVRLRLPSLHIFGTTDAVISSEMSEELARQFDCVTIVKHDGGHYVPVNAEVRQKCTDLLNSAGLNCSTNQNVL